VAKYNMGIIMKTIDINQLNDNDEEISDIFISSGMRPDLLQNPAYLQKWIQLHPLILRE